MSIHDDMDAMLTNITKTRQKIDDLHALYIEIKDRKEFTSIEKDAVKKRVQSLACEMQEMGTEMQQKTGRLRMEIDARACLLDDARVLRDEPELIEMFTKTQAGLVQARDNMLALASGMQRMASCKEDVDGVEVIEDTESVG